jgi:hypothetical protein
MIPRTTIVETVKTEEVYDIPKVYEYDVKIEKDDE